MTPDPAMARALAAMTDVRLRALSKVGTGPFTSILVEQHYEAIKELITALMAANGWKTYSHEVLVGYLKHFYKEFTEAEIALVDQLRKLRNDISYRGVAVNPEYWERNKSAAAAVITKLKAVLEKRLKAGRP